MEIKRDRYLNLLISRKHNELIKTINGMKQDGRNEYIMYGELPLVLSFTTSVQKTA